MRKVIWSLWTDGLDRAPALVRLCLERWATLNPGYELQVLDEARAREHVADLAIDPADLSVQALSDVLRCSLLRNGGIWVDATTLPLQPLGNWLPKVMHPAGFFAFDADADRPLASWFLAAAPHHLLVEHWWELVHAYWDRPRRLATVPGARFIIPTDPVASVSPPATDGSIYPYFWFHYLFRRLVERDAECAAAWSLVPRVSALAPHRLQLLFRSHEAPSDQAMLSALAGTPLQKLDWRQHYPLERLELLLGPPRADDR